MLKIAIIVGLSGSIAAIAGIVYQTIRARELFTLGGISYIASAMLFESLGFGLQLRAGSAAAGFVVQAAGMLILARGLFLLFADLRQRQLVRTALYDVESRLPNRSAWKRWRSEHPESVNALLEIESIESTRRLDPVAIEEALFDTLGKEIIADQESLGGAFAARVSLRSLAFGFTEGLQENENTRGYDRPLLQFRVMKWEQALRSNGFTVSWHLRWLDTVLADPDDEGAENDMGNTDSLQATVTETSDSM